MSDATYDAVVVGAGIAGSACAGMLARHGLRVALLDPRAEEKAGARWVNAVPAAAFDDARVARPAGDELCASGHVFEVASPSAAVRIRMDAHDVWEVDMRALGTRLRREAREAGVSMRFESPVDRVHIERGRVRALDVNGDTLRAALFIDASGMHAVLRRARFASWAPLDRRHICTAAQGVFDIADRRGAEEFVAREGMNHRGILARTGIEGGFSVLNVRIDLEAGHVAVLTGSIQDRPGRASGAQMLEAFIAREPWIGARRFGGAGAIPLRRPYSRLGAEGLALLGDAGCMVFAAHGSGIATSLRAARLLADSVRRYADPGSADATWDYSAAFHRHEGGVLLAYDVVRRLTQSLARDELEALLATGIVTAASVRAGFVQAAPPVSWAELVRVARASVRAPRLAMKAGMYVRNVPACLAHPRSYPAAFDLRALAAYETRSAALVGDALADAVE
jgi:electron transfer flavoprotein-quinone oxidoreductase